MLLATIAEILGLNAGTDGSRDIKWLLTDSRQLSFAPETLFFALKTVRNNGHRYISELYAQGVMTFVVSEEIVDKSAYPDATFLTVPNTLLALQQVAAAHRASFRKPVVGITGSNGKTIVKEWLFQLLHADLLIVRSPRSYNSQTGVPLSVWQLKSEADMGIFEAGISETGEMARLQPVIRPTIGVFTMIGEAHQEHFESTRQKIREKLMLFKEAETLIYCADHDEVAEEIRNSNIPARMVSWGRDDRATLKLLSVLLKESSTELQLTDHNNTFTFHIPFIDRASVENALHCITLMWVMHYDESTINERLALLETVAMRLEVKAGRNRCLIINDSYNSDLSSLSIALDFMSQQAGTRRLSKTLILSDILQSGVHAEELYARVASLITARGVDRLIGVGKDLSRYAGLFTQSDKRFFISTGDLLQALPSLDFDQEVILLKGSRIYHFESVLEQLELVAHETILEVNLNALVDNLNYFRSLLHPTTRVMCMVKAFAYGSGSVEIARALQHHRADCLAVAVADEGAELRQAGIRIPLLVMNPEKSSFATLFEHRLEPEVYSLKLLNELIEAVGRQGLTDYPIHLKIDSGMHRLGFEPGEVEHLISILQGQNQLKIRSMFSHLAGADDKGLNDFTHRQVQTFVEVADRISEAFDYPIMRHVLNSAGTERFPEYQFDMVRLGIGHYGVSALPEQQLPQVCRLKTIVLQLKEVHAGESVGYSRRAMLTEDRLIAVLPIGYADGFNRHFGNGVGEVWINGRRAPVIGNVSMDLTTVDVTGIAVKEGDEVEIFGSNITISELASRLNTIPYEILTGVSRRVKRVYFQE